MNRLPPSLAAALVALLAAGRARADEPPAAPAPFTTTVTAPPSAPSTPREDSSAAASVILPAESPRAFDDSGSLLLEVPGVNVTRTGSAGAYATVTLRGSNPDEVLIFIDGVPLNIAEGGGVDISTLPLGDIERVEVYRGSTPLAFGESALGGVISITTRTPVATRALVRAGVGSFGTWFGDVAGGGRVGRLRLYLGVHVFSSQGDYRYQYNLTPANPANAVDTTRQNNDAVEGNGLFRAALTLTGRRTLSLGLLGFARMQGLTGNFQYPTMFARFHTARGVGYLRYESRDDLGPGGRLSVEGFTSVERDRLLDPDGEVLGRGPLTTHETTVSSGVTAHGTRPLGDWARAAAVLEGRRETYLLDNETTPTMSGAPARRWVGVVGGEVDLRWPLLDLHLIPSVRLEALSDVVTGQNAAGVYLPAGPAIDRLLPVYRLGLVRPLGDEASFKANIGRYARAPSFLELYGNGNERILGNPSLLPERGTNGDLALWIDRAGPRLSLVSRTTAFGALVDDLVYWPHNAQGSARPLNLSSARIYGLEQELRLALGRHVRLAGEGTLLVAEDESQSSVSHGKQVPHHPRQTSYLRPELVNLALPLGLVLAAYVDAALFAGSYYDPGNRQPVATTLLVGAGVTVRCPRAHLRATASALDLTNVQTVDILTWPLPGRTLFLALAYEPAGDSAGDLGVL